MLSDECGGMPVASFVSLVAAVMASLNPYFVCVSESLLRSDGHGIMLDRIGWLQRLRAAINEGPNRRQGA